MSSVMDKPTALPMTLPLVGTRLVEASAGTGKTWTIAALYVRLVLGHGEGPGRPLAPAEILVMTFTKAATRELSQRIRERLVEAAVFFRRPEADDENDERNESNTDKQPDTFLQTLRATYAPGEARDLAAWRLAAAAEAMDDASVHTIDAWCQRMLREHAFDSGCLFDEELQPNETQMLREAARDYWRQQVYPLPAAALTQVQQQWPSVHALATDVRPLLEQPLAADAGAGDLAERIAAAMRAQQERRAALKHGWRERVRAMRAWLEGAIAGKSANLRPSDVKNWLGALDAWAADPVAEAPAMTDTGWERLTRTDLEARKKGPLPPRMPEGFDAMAPLRAELQRPCNRAALLRAHAVARVRQRMQQLKQQAGRYGYADMLQRLDDALDEQRRGAHAAQLRARILAQYPAALIDEFQDTSPRQLSIFERLYRLEDDDPARVLLLIGDPKQSIYAFRGADIHSYLHARAATAGRHHALDTNRRSTHALVRAVNTLFARAEARPGRGAFLFRDAGTAGSAGLPFVAVHAQGRRESLQRGGATLPALTFCVDTELRGTGDHRTRFAALCAERIVELLNDRTALFVEDGKAPRRLASADIAVLVRTGTEAEAVQRALRRRGVASVYLSDKDSVYQRDEAADLLRLLQAVAEPRNVRLARAAFATGLLGRTLAELRRLAADDLAFDAQSAHLLTLHLEWRTQGVLAMLRRALHLFAIPARLLAAGDGEGERRLTNVLHLAELLQTASATVEGEAALVRWLAGQIEAAEGDFTPAEELVLRLESDADLVQVVTVHKSKGLEYPVVFVPFASVFRDARQDSWVLQRDAAGRAQQVDLAPDDAARTARDDERLQEDVRLLYVALTRARHALWAGAAALRHGNGRECLWHRSALGMLVSGEAPGAPERIEADLRGLAEAAAQGAASDAAVITLDVLAVDAALPLTAWQPLQAAAALPPARVYDGTFERRWTLASYSALVRDAAHRAAADSAGEAVGDTAADSDTTIAPPPGPLPMNPPSARRDDDEDDDHAETIANDAIDVDVVPRVITAARGDAPWHRFPRGAFAGNFLHDQLEWLAGEGFALDDSPALRDALARRCERQGHGARAADVVTWLTRVLAQPLPPLGTSLANLRGRVLPEMEFWLDADGLDAARLDALCREHLFAHAPRPPLTPRVLHGLLMGFADLVLEHADAGGDGDDSAPMRTGYWVLDYKSNTLGPRDDDYTDAAMRAAMLRHRYDVQAALYLLALHRLLRRRLGAGYEPARDLRGAIYYFLRGVGHAGSGCMHVPAPPVLLEALEAMLP